MPKVVPSMTDVADADLMAVGTHCQFPECNQLDFLPFKCSGCKWIFCQEHRTAAAHTCPHAEESDVQVIICPVCALAVKLTNEAEVKDPNLAFERHSRTNCNPAHYSKVHKKKKCPVKLCKEKLISTNSVTCKDCGAVTCLRHRLAEDHSCPGPPIAPPSGFRAAFGNFFSNSLGSNATATRKAPISTATTTTRSPSRMASAQTKVSSMAKKASTSLQTQLQDYRASHKTRIFPKSATTTATTAAAEQCPQCGQRFSTVLALIDHASSAHSDGWSSGNTLPVRPSSASTGGNERCPHCAASFDDPVALVHHVESKHGNREPAEVCVLL